jgi:ParB family chromosome partitioning protein
LRDPDDGGRSASIVLAPGLRLLALAGKDVVHAMLADVASPTVADGNKSETGKVRKGIIRDCLEGTNGRPKRENWLPPYLQFPAKGYTDRGGINVVERWQSVAGLFA